MITLLGEEGAGRCAGRLVGPRFMVSALPTLPLGDRGGLLSLSVALPGICFTVFLINPHFPRGLFLLIKWTSPFPVLGVSGALFHFYSIHDRNSY